MSNTIQVNIPVTSTDQAEMYIAALGEVDFHAFEQVDNVLSAYIREEFVDENILDAILSKTGVNFTKVVIEDINWNQKWEEEFTPVVIDSFVAVRAAFHSSIKNVEHEIIITPKMSFGTGHHATTFLMLQQMKKIDFKNRKVLDFGTGTGVLAILASKAGADTITAIDNDGWSIENARENFIANNCDNINLLKTDSIADLGEFDIILANINLNVITQNIFNLKHVCHLQTTLLLSGFLFSDAKLLTDTFSGDGFICNEINDRDGWISGKFSLAN